MNSISVPKILLRSALSILFCICELGFAQFGGTLTQVDMGINNNDPANDKRLTMNVTQDLINRKLFSMLHSSAPVDFENEVGHWQIMVCTDAGYSRLIYGDFDKWIKAYGSWGEQVGRFRHPMGIDRNSLGKLFIADVSNNRIVACKIKFKNNGGSTESTYIEHLGYITTGLKIPQDVAWDDNGTVHVSNDKLWVVDSGHDRIRKYSINTDDTFTLDYGYGTGGSGVGQFKYPTRIAVGRSNGYNDDNIYVIDSGNQRIVWLEDTPQGIQWRGEYSDPGPGVTYFSSIETDWYGGVWVTVEDKHQVLKLTRELQLLDYYGTYGFGQTYGLLYGPRDYSIQFGYKKNSDGTKEWIGHPGSFVTEKWGGNSGGVCYEMGTAITYVTGVVEQSNYYSEYAISDYSEVTLRIRRSSDDVLIKTIFYKQARAYGSHNDVWDGTDLDGNPAPAGDYYSQVRAKSLYTDSEYIYKTSAPFYWPGSQPKKGALQETDRLPLEYALYQNTPNPFSVKAHETSGNPETVIRYDVPESGNVNITVYDMTGRIVKTLSDVNQAPGSHQIKWDGRNSLGRKVGSGLYFYVMRINDFISKRRLLLLR